MLLVLLSRLPPAPPIPPPSPHINQPPLPHGQMLNVIFCSAGGYDHVVRLWDVRSAQCVLSCNHGAPVEDVAFFPSGSLAVTAGGNQLCIWDMLRCGGGGGRGSEEGVPRGGGPRGGALLGGGGPSGGCREEKMEWREEGRATWKVVGERL